jgi:hypothetical protein
MAVPRKLKSCFLFLVLWSLSMATGAQQSPGPTPSNAQLDQMTASIALYPDALLSQVLMASTYPADVAAAAEWSRAHPEASGDAAVKEVAGESWDPSVQSLAAFPSVLDLMGRQPQWVQELGDAFLAEPGKVMDSVQRLRARAKQAGALKSSPQQTVTSTQQAGREVVVIEPASPQVVYVPAYDPVTVYGAWPYPAYPPVYAPPPPGSAFLTGLAGGIGFGVGVAAVNSLWGNSNWGHGDVDINVNRYNNINDNRHLNVNGGQTAWQHNPANRGNVPYANAATRNQFDAQRQSAVANRGAAGNPAARPGAQANASRDAARTQAARTMQTRTGVSIGRAGGGAQAAAGNRTGGRSVTAGGAARNANGTARNTNTAGRATNYQSRQQADRSSARSQAHQTNRPSAFRDAGNGAATRQQLTRARPEGGGMRAGGEHGFTHAGPGRAGAGRHMGR